MDDPMIMSMTGFGRGETEDGERRIAVEIRSVNHRYGEVSVKLPRRYAFAEEAVKRSVRSGVLRGKTDVTVNVLSGAEEDFAVTVNATAAGQYFKALCDLRDSLGLKDEISVALLSGMPDVFRPAVNAIDEDAALAVIVSAVDAAMSDFNAMRSAEGAKLAADMAARADAVERAASVIEERAEGMPGVYAERLRVRVEELLEKDGGTEITKDRIALEAAILADKSDVTEEIVRLRSHLEQMRGMLAADSSEPVGKKLDFLVQEMNREANTIASKTGDIDVTRMTLDIKSEVEKIREQVQNIE
jgi:uncharacterized protein (TIGR00255 family)